jgi:hypothetical protein
MKSPALGRAVGSPIGEASSCHFADSYFSPLMSVVSRLTDDPEHWRKRAEEMRTIANAMTDMARVRSRSFELPNSTS